MPEICGSRQYPPKSSWKVLVSMLSTPCECLIRTLQYDEIVNFLGKENGRYRPYGFVKSKDTESSCLRSSRPSDVFPERLRTAREQRGLNRRDLAKRAGLQPSAISHFETGTRKPSFDNLRRLADALEVTTDYLLGRVKDFTDLAGADKLHRHYDRLSSDDRDVAEKMLELLARKAASRARKEEA